MPIDEGDEGEEAGGRVAWAGLLAGPLLAAVTYAALPDTYADEAGAIHSLGHAGRVTGALTVWMAVWWMTEAIPVYATALLPLALLPVLGALSIHQAAAPYSHELIYLFMGGFILALSMQRWGLDQRISLLALRLVGTEPAAIVAGFMGVTAALSMWVSNTATSVMMLPIAVGVIELVAHSDGRDEPDWRSGRSGFSTCLLLGIAYGASIGGVGTIIGTPPNLFLASFAKTQLGYEIGFARWMAIGLPLVALMLPVAWLLLTRVLFRLDGVRVEGGRQHVATALAEIGPIKRGEWVTLIVFTCTALAWLTRPWLARLRWGDLEPLAGLSDPGIAVVAALTLFVVPIDARRRVFAMDWATARKLPWGLLVLFGGGLSLASAIRSNGLDAYLGHSVTILAGLPTPIVMLAVVTIMIFLTEITSNTATAATWIPILAGMAPGLGMHPLLLIVPAAIAASCAFMLPVATPPNAVVFGSGMVRLPDMCRAGIWLNLIAILIVTGLCYGLALSLLGVEVGASLAPPP